MKIDNFIARGEVRNMQAHMYKDLTLKDTSFSFFTDNSDTIVKNIKAKTKGIIIKEGSLNINKNKSETKIKSDFKTNLSLKKIDLMKYLSGREELDQIDKNSNLKALLSHNLDIIFDNTFKIQDFVYKSKGKLDYVNLFIHDDKKIDFFDFNIQNIIMKDTNLDFRFGFDKKNYINLSGIYNVNDLDFKKFSFKNNFLTKVQTLYLSLST